MDNISMYFMTTDKAIITKLDQNSIQIELAQIVEFGTKKICGLGHMTYFKISEHPQYT